MANKDMARINFVAKCVVNNTNKVPDDIDDEQEWILFWQREHKYMVECFVRAMDEGIYLRSELKEFVNDWKKIEQDLAECYGA